MAVLAAFLLLTVFAAASTAQVSLPSGAPIGSLNNQRGEHGRTALHEAAAHCRVNDARFLIEHGADIQAKDDSSATPAELAAQCSPEVRAEFQKLMPPPQLSGVLSLEHAIAHRQTQVVSMLVGMGFSVNAMAEDGDRPLNTAAAAGDAATTKFLLERGADPNLPSRSGNTPLHDAALHGDAEAIGLLLAHGARVNTPTLDDGSTALHIAASFDRLDAVKALVQHGADTTLKNAGGFTAADLAVRNKFADVTAYLMSAHR